MSATRYFHGSTHKFVPGDVVVPGVECGRTYYGRSHHVYGTSTEFDVQDMEWEPEQDTVSNRVNAAMDEAMQWASFAADRGGCVDPTHQDEDTESGYHYEMYLEGSWLPCINVYEIEPIGAVEKDGSSDVNATGVRMERATVLRNLSWEDMPDFEY